MSIFPCLAVTTYLTFPLMDLKRVLIFLFSLLSYYKRLPCWNKEYDTIICVPRPWSFILGSRINLTLTPMEVRVVFLHLVVVTMTKAIHKRVYFGLPFRRVSPQWWGGVAMGGQRRKMRDHIFNHVQKAECKNYKWGEA